MMYIVLLTPLAIEILNFWKSNVAMIAILNANKLLYLGNSLTNWTYYAACMLTYFM